MARLIYELEGVRGRSMKLYDTKCVITTSVTVGSVLTRNATDGEKTVFFCDVVGVQYKNSGKLIGYLQLETPSLQMNNQNSNMFSENTFTFEDGTNGVTNALMRAVCNYITDRIEEIKYGVKIIENEPDFDKIVSREEKTIENEPDFDKFVSCSDESKSPEKYMNIYICPECKNTVKKGQEECNCSCKLDWSKYI